MGLQRVGHDLVTEQQLSSLSWLGVCVCVSGCTLSHSAIPWTVAHQDPLSMEFSRQNTGVGSHFLFQGIFQTQGLNLGLLHFRQILYHLWRKKWQPTLVFLTGKSHGRRRLVGYSPQGHKHSDTTERLHFTFTIWATREAPSWSYLLFIECLLCAEEPVLNDIEMYICNLIPPSTLRSFIFFNLF